MRMLPAFPALLALLAIAPSTRAQEEDVKKAPSCPHCGMDREKFAQSRMVIEYEDGSSVGTCSIHCAAVELATALDKAPKALLVGDAGTKKLLDAEKAFWVVGGNRPGVMTRRAKWAFETQEAAKAFMRENGGELATFDQAMKAAYEDMYTDTKMIREKRRAMQHRSHEMKH